MDASSDATGRPQSVRQNQWSQLSCMHYTQGQARIQLTRQVATWYTLVIYTASMPEYADPVIDWLDAGRSLFAKRLYRDSCFLQSNGSYIKDLALVEKDLSRVCFMDNSPVSYAWNKGESYYCQ